jgi:eukaryotic-like serine/threonine-protein kinase
MNRWQQIDELFAQALAHPPAERTKVLAACDDADVRREVASLLDHYPTASEFLENTVGGAVSAWAAREAETAQASVMGRRIGAYEIIGVIGQGGMGAVYRGRRVDGAFEHDVAIKVVRHGFETAAALTRFRQERQILARLTHPDIARLLDGGTIRDDAGVDTPYLVLEYVEGATITAYCAARNLSIPERLALFRRIGDAVLHAHQRLIVHRDLKPSNILVTADGQPKLLDFGIAKLLIDSADESLAETPAPTMTGVSLLTPEYASPEQVRGEHVTVATDIYALGALLYELLTSQTAHRLQTRSPAEIARVVCEEPIVPPSVAVVANAATAAGAAGGSPSAAKIPPLADRSSTALPSQLAAPCSSAPANPATDRTSTAWPGRLASPAGASANKIRRQLAGDLDTIVMKALRKEPERRYASVEHLSDDLRRYLAGLPVSARPDTATYRIGKLVRRNKTLIAALILAVASLIGGLLISVQQARRANRRFDDVRTLATRLLNEVAPALRVVPGTARPQRLLATLSMEYLDRLRADASDDPALLLEIAEGYAALGGVEGSIDSENLGRYDAALAMHAKVLSIVDQLIAAGRFDARVALLAGEAHLERGNMLATTGARTEAMAAYRQAIAVAERWRRVSPDDRKLIPIATSAEVRMGDLLMATGRIADAKTLFEQSLARATRSRESFPTITTRARLAGALREAGSPERALALFRTCLEETQEAGRQLPRSQGRLHTLTLIQADIGLTLAGREGPSLGQTAEGLAAYRAALDTGRALAQASNRDPFAVSAWIEAAVGFGTVAAEVEPDAARDTLTEALAQLTPQLTQPATETRLLEGRARSALAGTLVRLGRPADARPYAEAAQRTLRTLVDRDPENAAFGDALVMAGVNFGDTLAALGDTAGAEEQLRDAVRLAERLTAATPDRPRAHRLQAIAASRLSALAALRAKAR